MLDCMVIVYSAWVYNSLTLLLSVWLFLTICEGDKYMGSAYIREYFLAD